MRPAIVSGMVSRECVPQLFLGWLQGKHQSIIGKFCKSQLGSVFFDFLNGEWVFSGNFWIEGKCQSQGPRYRWERDWFLECSCQTCVKPTSEPQGKIVGLPQTVPRKLCPCLKTFVAPFLLSQLFYPGPPRMLLNQQHKFWLFSS